MRADVLEISHGKRESQRKLKLDKGTRDALADYCKARWATGAAKAAAREWDLSTDEARGVIAGRSSLTTYDKIKKAGGWPVIIAVEAKVIGQGIDQYLIELRASHEQQSERLGALVADLWPGRRAGGDPPAGVDHGEGERRHVAGRRVG
jgi:hypothetical protein